MQKKLRLCVLTLISFSALPKKVFAADGILEGDVPTFKWIETLLSNVISALVYLIGFASFAMLIVGAFQYLTAGDSKEGVQKAGQTITYAILGAFLILVIWFAFVFIEKFTGAHITSFELNIN